MRLVCIFAVALAFAAPAAAQTKSPSTPVPVVAAVDVAPEQLEATNVATRDFLHALMFDIGLLDRIADAYLPTIRRDVVSSPYYIQATPEQREALNRWVDSAPGVLREEFTLEFEVMAANMAPGLAAFLTPEEIGLMADFFRTPELRPMMTRMIGRGIATGFDDVDVEPTDAELRLLSNVMNTPTGAVIIRHGERFLSLLNQEVTAATPRIMARVQLRSMTGICAAMGPDCPDSIREMTTPT